MARIRTIKPSFWEDEKIAKLPIPCRLFFIGTWSIADDAGLIRGGISYLRSQIFPYDEGMRLSEVKGYVDALVKARMLIPLSYKEEGYYVIRTFRGHQKFDPRYPNYILKPAIEDELIANVISCESDCFEYTAGTQWGPSGCPPRDGDGDGEISDSTVTTPTDVVVDNSTPLKSINLKNQENACAREREIDLGVSEKKKSTASENCDKREKIFYDELSRYVPIYGKDLVRKFFNYWTERNKGRTKMRFELEKTWDLPKRLTTWSNNNLKYEKGRTSTSLTQKSTSRVSAGFKASILERLGVAGSSAEVPIVDEGNTLRR